MADSQKTILVVEDEEALQEAIKHKLISAGYAVKQARSAEQAMEIMGQEPPALLWLDLLLPGMGGFQLLENLRQKPEWRNLPVIIVSVSASQEKIKRAFELNVLDYIVKSQYRLEHIIKRIGELLRNA